MWRRTSECALSAQMENSGTAITLRPTKINGTDMLDMWVIFMDISAAQSGCRPWRWGPAVVVVNRYPIRSVDAAGQPTLGLGMPPLDDYLALVAGRCRPNTVLATTYELRVFLRRRRQATGAGG